MEQMKVLVVGLGLIGGSMCKAMRRFTNHLVYGYDTDGAVLEQAVRDGAILEAVPKSGFHEFDLIMVCLHPRAAKAFFDAHIPDFRPGAILTDVCGIKGALVEHVIELAAEYGQRYVGMHPMAGKERFGYPFSEGSLFLGANCIITPIPQTSKEAVCILEQLVHDLGFAHIVETTPEGHDAMIAYTSQLAHVVSSAYVKSPTLEQENGYSGGSFQDMTRTATLNEEMWASLFLENRKPLLFELNTLIENLQAYRDAIDRDDYTTLVELLRDGRIRKEQNLLSHAKDRRE